MNIQFNRFIRLCSDRTPGEQREHGEGLHVQLAGVRGEDRAHGHGGRRRGR